MYTQTLELTENEVKLLARLYNTCEEFDMDAYNNADTSGLFDNPRTLSGVMSSLVQKEVIGVARYERLKNGQRVAGDGQWYWRIERDEIVALLRRYQPDFEPS